MHQAVAYHWSIGAAIEIMCCILHTELTLENNLHPRLQEHFIEKHEAEDARPSPVGVRQLVGGVSKTEQLANHLPPVSILLVRGVKTVMPHTLASKKLGGYATTPHGQGGTNRMG